MRIKISSTRCRAALLTAAALLPYDAMAQTAPAGAIGRRPIASSPFAGSDRLANLRGLVINNGTFPQYRTGIDLDIRHPDIRQDGPNVRVQLYLPLDNIRMQIVPQAQVDGRLIAHLPSDLYARAQSAELTVIIGDTNLRNTTGKFVPEIAPVPERLVHEGTSVRCETMCVTWPASKERSVHWLTTTRIRDQFEHTAPTGEEVGGKWSVGQTTYRLTSRRLKDQFRFSNLRVASPSIAGGCPVNARENVWIYPGKPMPFPDSPESLRQLDIYARANVTHCRGRGKNNFDATHFVFAEMNVEVAIEGPKGVNPWE